MSWKDVDVWDMPRDDHIKRDRSPEPFLPEPSPDDDLLDDIVKVRAESIVRGMELR
jgi:hypothetical protein